MAEPNKPASCRIGNAMMAIVDVNWRPIFVSHSDKRDKQGDEVRIASIAVSSSTAVRNDIRNNSIAVSMTTSAGDPFYLQNLVEDKAASKAPHNRSSALSTTTSAGDPFYLQKLAAVSGTLLTTTSFGDLQKVLATSTSGALSTTSSEEYFNFIQRFTADKGASKASLHNKHLDVDRNSTAARSVLSNSSSDDSFMKYLRKADEDLRASKATLHNKNLNIDRASVATSGALSTTTSAGDQFYLEKFAESKVSVLSKASHHKKHSEIDRASVATSGALSTTTSTGDPFYLQNLAAASGALSHSTSQGDPFYLEKVFEDNDVRKASYHNKHLIIDRRSVATSGKLSISTSQRDQFYLDKVIEKMPISEKVIEDKATKDKPAATNRPPDKMTGEFRPDRTESQPQTVEYRNWMYSEALAKFLKIHPANRTDAQNRALETRLIQDIEAALSASQLEDLAVNTGDKKKDKIYVDNVFALTNLEKVDKVKALNKMYAERMKKKSEMEAKDPQQSELQTKVPSVLTPQQQAELKMLKAKVEKNKVFGPHLSTAQNASKHMYSLRAMSDRLFQKYHKDNFAVGRVPVAVNSMLKRMEKYDGLNEKFNYARLSASKSVAQVNANKLDDGKNLLKDILREDGLGLKPEYQNLDEKGLAKLLGEDVKDKIIVNKRPSVSMEKTSKESGLMGFGLQLEGMPPSFDQVYLKLKNPSTATMKDLDEALEVSMPELDPRAWLGRSVAESVGGDQKFKLTGEETRPSFFRKLVSTPAVPLPDEGAYPKSKPKIVEDKAKDEEWESVEESDEDSEIESDSDSESCSDSDSDGSIKDSAKRPVQSSTSVITDHTDRASLKRLDRKVADDLKYRSKKTWGKQSNEKGLVAYLSMYQYSARDPDDKKFVIPNNQGDKGSKRRKGSIKEKPDPNTTARPFMMKYDEEKPVPEGYRVYDPHAEQEARRKAKAEQLKALDSQIAAANAELPGKTSSKMTKGLEGAFGLVPNHKYTKIKPQEEGATVTLRPPQWGGTSRRSPADPQTDPVTQRDTEPVTGPDSPVIEQKFSGFSFPKIRGKKNVPSPQVPAAAASTPDAGSSPKSSKRPSLPEEWTGSPMPYRSASGDSAGGEVKLSKLARMRNFTKNSFKSSQLASSFSSNASSETVTNEPLRKVSPNPQRMPLPPPNNEKAVKASSFSPPKTAKTVRIDLKSMSFPQSKADEFAPLRRVATGSSIIGYGPVADPMGMGYQPDAENLRRCAKDDFGLLPGADGPSNKTVPYYLTTQKEARAFGDKIRVAVRLNRLTKGLPYEPSQATKDGEELMKSRAAKFKKGQAKKAELKDSHGEHMQSLLDEVTREGAKKAFKTWQEVHNLRQEPKASKFSFQSSFNPSRDSILHSSRDHMEDRVRLGSTASVETLIPAYEVLAKRSNLSITQLYHAVIGDQQAPIKVSITNLFQCELQIRKARHNLAKLKESGEKSLFVEEKFRTQTLTRKEVLNNRRRRTAMLKKSSYSKQTRQNANQMATVGQARKRKSLASQLNMHDGARGKAIAALEGEIVMLQRIKKNLDILHGVSVHKYVPQAVVDNYMRSSRFTMIDKLNALGTKGWKDWADRTIKAGQSIRVYRDISWLQRMHSEYTGYFVEAELDQQSYMAAFIAGTMKKVDKATTRDLVTFSGSRQDLEAEQYMHIRCPLSGITRTIKLKQKTDVMAKYATEVVLPDTFEIASMNDSLKKAAAMELKPAYAKAMEPPKIGDKRGLGTLKSLLKDEKERTLKKIVIRIRPQNKRGDSIYHENGWYIVVSPEDEPVATDLGVPIVARATEKNLTALQSNIDEYEKVFGIPAYYINDYGERIWFDLHHRQSISRERAMSDDGSVVVHYLHVNGACNPDNCLHFFVPSQESIDSAKKISHHHDPTESIRDVHLSAGAAVGKDYDHMLAAHTIEDWARTPTGLELVNKRNDEFVLLAEGDGWVVGWKYVGDRPGAYLVKESEDDVKTGKKKGSDLLRGYWAGGKYWLPKV